MKKATVWRDILFYRVVDIVALCSPPVALNLLLRRQSTNATIETRANYNFLAVADVALVEEWLKRAHTNAITAKMIAERKDPDLMVEAVSQLQQAAEKATKGFMIASGVPPEEVEELQHNTSGAFLELMISLMDREHENLDWNSLDLSDAPVAGYNLIGPMLPKRRRINRKIKLRLVMESLFHGIHERSYQINTDWRLWRKEISTWSEETITWMLDVHAAYREMWDSYIDGISKSGRHRSVDPRPLLSGEVSPDIWVFDKNYAGLSEWFIKGRTKTPLRLQHAKAINAYCDYLIKVTVGRVPPQLWPTRVDLRAVLYAIRDHTSAMLYLYVLGVITTPHATTSRYPSHGGKEGIGTQDYNSDLGIIRCVGRLSRETELTIRRLKKMMDRDTWCAIE